MYALLRERQMKRCCSKTDVFKHCEIDSGVCMNRIYPAEFMLKSEENPLLCQILSKMEFPTWYQIFIMFSKDWINESNEYMTISGIQNRPPKGLSEQSSFTSDSYKIFVKQFHFCVS